MKQKRYMDDWVNETRIDEHGREKRLPVYRGDWYVLPLTEREKKKALVISGGLWAVCFGTLIAYYLASFAGVSTIYVFVPSALGLFPMLYWQIGILYLAFSAPQKQTRQQKESGIARIVRCTAGLMALNMITVIADLVHMFILPDIAAGELPGFCLLLAGLAGAVLAWRHSKAILDRVKVEHRKEVSA